MSPDCVEEATERGKDRAYWLPLRKELEALRHASTSLEHGRAQLTLAGAGELLAEDLRQAQQSLGEITGAFSSDDLLGRIFSSFCIGK